MAHRQIVRNILKQFSEPAEPKIAKGKDLRRYRLIEREIYQEVSAELALSGQPMDPGVLAWAVDEVRSRLAKAVGR